MNTDPDETRLRRILLEKRSSGELPAKTTGRTWAGPGTHSICALCDQHIEQGEVEYEVEWQKNGSEALLRFHLQCFRVWTVS